MQSNAAAHARRKDTHVLCAQMCKAHAAPQHVQMQLLIAYAHITHVSNRGTQQHALAPTPCASLSPVASCRFQRWAPTAPAELTFTYNLVRAGSDIKLYYLGRATALQQLMQQHSGLLAFPGAVYRAVECDVLGSRGWLAGSGWAPLACRSDNVEVLQRVTPGGVLMKDREASK